MKCIIALMVSANLVGLSIASNSLLIQSFAGYEFGKSYDCDWHTNKFGFGACSISNDRGGIVSLARTPKGRLCGVSVVKRLETVPDTVLTSEKDRYDEIAFREVKNEIATLESRYGVKLRQHTKQQWSFGNGKSSLSVNWYSTTDITQEFGKPERMKYIMCINVERMDIGNADIQQQ